MLNTLKHWARVRFVFSLYELYISTSKHFVITLFEPLVETRSTCEFEFNLLKSGRIISELNVSFLK